MAAAKRLDIEQEKFYQCQNCNARVGCHKGTTRPLGNLANETLRMKRKETHQIFDSFWRERGMTRTQGYHWMAKKLRLSEQLAHIAQRNALVEKYLWCIDTVIRKNRPLMRAARLEYDDVYQQLALRLIRAVAGFDPQKGTLQQHIFAQLKYELLNCKSAYRLCGLTGAPKEYRKSDMVSLDHIPESSPLYEQVMAA